MLRSLNEGGEWAKTGNAMETKGQHGKGKPRGTWKQTFEAELKDYAKDKSEDQEDDLELN